MDIVYISGYGRSGSTLLETLLAHRTGATPLGEIGYLPDCVAGRKDFDCECGAKVANCDFWRQVVTEFESDGSRLEELRSSARLEKLVALPRRLVGRVGEDDERRARAHSRLLRIASGDAATVVDSSKTAYRFAFRPLMLSLDPSNEVRTVHLVRDPRAVAYSLIKGDNSRIRRGAVRSARPLPVLRAVIGWYASNFAALVSDRNLPHCVTSYETLASAPDDELDRIVRGLSFEVRSDVEKPSAVQGHRIAGNRMVATPSGKLKIVLDRSWEENLSPPLNRTIAALTYPMTRLLRSV